MAETNTLPFGLWLLQEMVRNNMDKLDVEIATGISSTTIMNYIKGTTTPTLNNLEKILSVFGKHLEIVDDIRRHENGVCCITMD